MFCRFGVSGAYIFLGYRSRRGSQAWEWISEFIPTVSGGRGESYKPLQGRFNPSSCFCLDIDERGKKHEGGGDQLAMRCPSCQREDERRWVIPWARLEMRQDQRRVFDFWNCVLWHVLRRVISFHCRITHDRYLNWWFFYLLVSHILISL